MEHKLDRYFAVRILMTILATSEIR